MTPPTDDRGATGAAASEPTSHDTGPSIGVRAMVGAGVLAVVAVGVLATMRSREPSRAAPATAMVRDEATAVAPSKGKETAAQIEAEFAKAARWTNAETLAFFRRFAAAGPDGQARAKELAGQIVLEIDPDFAPARAALGQRRFEHDVKDIDAIAFRDYPYIRIVEYAIEARWLDETSHPLATEAWEKTAAHIERLQDDSTFRAIDIARSEIARDREFKDYVYEAAFASPYLICYSSAERVTAEDLAKMSIKEQIAKLSELDRSREKFRKVLTEKALILQQLYAEFLKRYQEPCGLRPLMDKFGGRPSLPVGKRSYKDGCPLIVWVFPDRKAWDQFHAVAQQNPAPLGVAGYFSPKTGWVYLYDEVENRQFEVNKTVHESTHQLEHWFQRQKRDWGRPVVPQSFFGEGFAEYIGSVTMAADRTLTFHGVNAPRLDYLRAMKESLEKSGQTFKLFSLKDLVGLAGYDTVGRRGGELGFRDPLGLFYAQSWALVYFLNEASNQKYQAQFSQFLNDMLLHPRVMGPRDDEYSQNMFKRRMAIRGDSDWKKLDTEFKKWLQDDLLTVDPSKYAPPPTLDDWPEYEPLRPIDPRDPSTWATK